VHVRHIVFVSAPWSADISKQFRYVIVLSKGCPSWLVIRSTIVRQSIDFKSGSITTRDWRDRPKRAIPLLCKEESPIHRRKKDCEDTEKNLPIISYHKFSEFQGINSRDRQAQTAGDPFEGQEEMFLRP
jgi:hypothetical protein